MISYKFDCLSDDLVALKEDTSPILLIKQNDTYSFAKLCFLIENNMISNPTAMIYLDSQTKKVMRKELSYEINEDMFPISIDHIDIEKSDSYYIACEQVYNMLNHQMWNENVIKYYKNQVLKHLSKEMLKVYHYYFEDFMYLMQE